VLHHLWVYADFEDRTFRRRALAADAEWTSGFGSRAFPMIERQETLLLALATTSPALDKAVAEAGTARHAPPGALLTTGWALLECGGRPRDDDRVVGAWRVLAGEQPGSALSLRRTEGMPDAMLSGEPAVRRELMTPCGFSPLA
jgi:hypothetical protein